MLKFSAYLYTALALTFVALNCFAFDAGEQRPPQSKLEPQQQPKENLPVQDPTPPAPAPTTPASPTLTISQRWALACPAILDESNHHGHDKLLPLEPTVGSLLVMKEGLKNSWGVSNREDLLKILSFCDEDGGHRKLWLEMAAVKTQSDAFFFLKNHEGKMTGEAFERKMNLVRKYQDQLGDKGILAWDYCRYIDLCRWGTACGYLTSAEAWTRIMPIARKLQSTFNSWEDVGNDYLVGREFWSKDATDKSGDYLRQTMKSLLTDKSSPWMVIPWQTDLSARVSNGF